MSNNLVQFVKKDKIAKFEYPDLPKFIVHLRYTGKVQLQEMLKECTEEKTDMRTFKKVDEVNEIKFKKLIATKLIVDWEGLNIAGLKNFILLDSAAIAAQGMTDETIVEATFENKMMLLDNSLEFDRWVNDVVHDLKRFKDETQAAACENLK